jgi:O-antigen ligase
VAQGSSFTPEFLHHPYWREARAVLGVPVAGAISVNPEATWSRLQGLLAYGGVFWLALQLCATRVRARQVMLALTSAGLLYAIYGLYAYFGRPGAVASTFVNRNSYATYAGLTLFCGLSLVVHSFARYARVDVPLRRALVHALSRLDLATTTAMLSCLACSMALLLTRSRGALVAVAVAFLLYVWLMRATFIIRSRAFYVLFIVIMLVTAVSLMLYSGEGTLQRLEESSANFSNRIVYYRTTWEAVQDRPLLGTGYGTYADAFMAYNHPETGTYFLDKAHSTYLQLVMELGWPAALALFSAIGYLAFRCLLDARRHPVAGRLQPRDAGQRRDVRAGARHGLCPGPAARPEPAGSATGRWLSHDYFAWMTPRTVSRKSDLTIGASARAARMRSVKPTSRASLTSWSGASRQSS